MSDTHAEAFADRMSSPRMRGDLKHFNRTGCRHTRKTGPTCALVLPIGDGLGRVLAEIIRQVKQFYATSFVPFCDHWDLHEHTQLPRAPYLLQGVGHPSPVGIQTIRARLRRLSLEASARTANGSPLELHPHDCRRVFASEHLNNKTPVHVIQALLGHATQDTVMVYAKLYPTHLVDEYRKALHGVYRALHGEESLRNPTVEEWAAFTASGSLRDMGTHVCALPTDEYCCKIREETGSVSLSVILKCGLDPEKWRI